MDEMLIQAALRMANRFVFEMQECSREKVEEGIQGRQGSRSVCSMQDVYLSLGKPHATQRGSSRSDDY